MRKSKKAMAAALAAMLIMAAIPVHTQAAADPSSKLLAEYNFNDKTTNDSVGENDATLYSNKEEAQGTYIDGKHGRALQLSTKGASDKFWLSIPYEVFDNDQDSFTISLCYKANGYNTIGEDSQLFSLYNSTVESFLYYSYAATKFQNMGYSMKWNGLTKSHGYANAVGVPYKKDQWVHLVYCVAAVDNQSIITAYVNGEAVKVDQGGDWDNSLMSTLGIDTFTIGGKNPYKGGDTPSCLFYGAIDDVRVYSGALTADEVKGIQLNNEIKEPPATTPATSAPKQSDASSTTSSAATPAPTKGGTSSSSNNGSSESSPFIVVGIVLAGVLVVAGAATGIVFRVKKSRKKDGKS